MAVEQKQIIRGGEVFNSFIGIDANGQSVDYEERVRPYANTDHILRYEPDTTTIVRGPKGSVNFIQTTYRVGLVGKDGEMISSRLITARQEDEELGSLNGKTSQADLIGFIAGLGMAIMKSGKNFFYRRFLKTQYRVFDTKAAGMPWVVLTPEQEQEPNNYNYDADALITNESTANS